MEKFIESPSLKMKGKLLQHLQQHFSMKQSGCEVCTLTVGQNAFSFGKRNDKETKSISAHLVCTNLRRQTESSVWHFITTYGSAVVSISNIAICTFRTRD